MRRAAVVLGGTGGLGHNLLTGLALDGPYRDLVRVGSRPTVLRRELPLLDMDHQIVTVHDVEWRVDGPRTSFNPLAIYCLRNRIYPELIINCIGLNHIQAVEKISLQALSQVLEVNVGSALFAGQLAIWAHAQRSELKLLNLIHPQPTLVLIGSSASDGAGAHSLAYVASKHALTGVTRSLSRDLAKRVTVLQINPPFLRDTDMSRYIANEQADLRGVDVDEERQRLDASSPAGQAMRSQEAAKLILGLVSEPHLREHLHGSIVRLGYAS